MPIPLNPIVSKIVEELLKGVTSEGAKKGAQWVYSTIGVDLSQKVVAFIGNLGAALVGELVTSGIGEVFPEMDDIPDKLYQRFTESQLAQIGRETTQKLGAGSKKALEKAGYSAVQMGAFVVLGLMDLQESRKNKPLKLKGLWKK